MWCIDVCNGGWWMGVTGCSREDKVKVSRRAVERVLAEGVSGRVELKSWVASAGRRVVGGREAGGGLCCVCVEVKIQGRKAWGWVIAWGIMERVLDSASLQIWCESRQRADGEVWGGGEFYFGITFLQVQVILLHVNTCRYFRHNRFLTFMFFC